jgi:Cu+-exporting ATPase
VLFSRSVFEVTTGIGSGYFDSLNALVFFLLMGKWYQAKTYQNFSFDRDLRSFLPLAANRLNSDGLEVPVGIDELKIGDRIRIRQGEVLPADSVLQEDSTHLDYSYLSGESLPIKKDKGSLIYAGARLLGKSVVVQVQRRVEHSYLSSLWSKEAFNADGAHKKSRSLSDKVSQYFTPAIIIIALLAGLMWWSVDSNKAVMVFTSVLIVACPCALALAEPFAAGSMLRWFGRFGFFLKNAAVLQRLPEVDHIVFDKTGTLTRTDAIQVAWQGDILSFEDQWAVATIALNAQHPLAKVLVQFLQIEETDASQVLSFEESNGEGVGARVRASYFRLGKASFLGLSDEATTTAVYLEKDAKVLGYFSFYQETREDLQEIAGALIKSYNLSLLSGDNAAEKRRFKTLLGPEVELKFDCSPHQKLEHLKYLQEQGERVLMLGDGLNDAGALQQSEVGVSLCEKNTSFFPASDALLMADSFVKLNGFLSLSRSYKPIVYRAFGLSFAYNIIGLSVAVAGYLTPVLAAILMPVSSVTVVLYCSMYTAYKAKKILN